MTPAVPSDGFESFLSAVRGMVHGDEAAPAGRPEPAMTAGSDVGAEPPDQPTPGPVGRGASADTQSSTSDRRPSSGEDEASDWLPGTWVAEGPPARGGRWRARDTDDSLARHERKLLEAERRNARKRRRKGSGGTPDPDAVQPSVRVEASTDPLARVPAQPAAPADEAFEEREPIGEQAGTAPRKKRRERRRDAARAQRLPAPADQPDPVGELVQSTATTEPQRSPRRGDGRERRRRSKTVAVDPVDIESSETHTVSRSMSETAPMSEVDAASEPSAKRRSRRHSRSTGGDGTSWPPEPVAEASEIGEAGRPGPPSGEPADTPASERVIEPGIGRAAELPPDDGPTPEEEPIRGTRAERRIQKRGAKVARRAAKEEEAAARKHAEAEEQRRRAEESQARQAAKAQQRAEREAADAEERRLRDEEKAARAAAEAEVRRKRAQEQAAQQAAKAAAVADERERRASREAVRAAEKAAARASARARRLEAKVARQEAKAAAGAAKRERRLDKYSARDAAKDSAQTAKLERRHELRARRLERRAARFEEKASAELAGLERRLAKRASRLAKRATRSEGKAQAAAESLERQREQIAQVASAPAVSSRRARRRQRRREAARAVAAAVPTTAEPDSSPRLDAPDGLSRRQRRRERRREAALERALTRVAEGLPPSADPDREDETLGEYLARVEAPILPRRSRRRRSRVPVRVRRAASITAVVVLIAGAAVLPWAAPGVRGLIADAVPGGDDSAVVPVKDPPVEPPEVTPGSAPVEQGDKYEGVELDSAGAPRQVVVPRLHVDSDVLPISGQSGALLPPSDPQVLGWWREGQPVGAAEGTAVITGHTVHTGGGALDHLDKLVVGDSLRVRTDDGWIRYVVQRARTYPTEELARDAEEIFRLDGPGRLVVITCDDWNGRSYESNAVVFATPVDDQPFDRG